MPTNHPPSEEELEILEGEEVSQVYQYTVSSLRELLPEEDAKIDNQRRNEAADAAATVAGYNKLMTDKDYIAIDGLRKRNEKGWMASFLRAGARQQLYFDPAKVRAAIVTCGGLCPGLNTVIRDLTLALYELYGVKAVYGIRGGYTGFHFKYNLNGDGLGDPNAPILLTPQGGTVLSTARGGFDLDRILKFCADFNVSQLYVIGGDGTHRGAHKIGMAAVERKLKLAVAGIPKTIDNDIGFIDRSFGFNTSVEEAVKAIHAGLVEAQSHKPNGIGIVKVMGRSSGFIAAYATLASADVDLCLIPETPIVLEGERGCLPHLERMLARRGYAVVVVAEGAGEELLGASAEVDAGGNKKLPPIGVFIKQQIQDYFDKRGKKTVIKYIDPSYMIRSVPPNAADSLYCMNLAQNAVHGAMAGYTSFSTGLVCNRLVYIPMPALTARSPRQLNPYGRTWERVLSQTRQPSTALPRQIPATALNPDKISD